MVCSAFSELPQVAGPPALFPNLFPIFHTPKTIGHFITYLLQWVHVGTNKIIAMKCNVINIFIHSSPSSITCTSAVGHNLTLKCGVFISSISSQGLLNPIPSWTGTLTTNMYLPTPPLSPSSIPSTEFNLAMECGTPSHLQNYLKSGAINPNSRHLNCL